MTYRTRQPFVYMLCVLAPLVTPLAQGAEDSQWGLGLVAGAMRKPYRDIGNDAIVFPLLSYENRWVRIKGPGIELKLAAGGSFETTLRARYSNDGYEAEDSPYLEGMRERKASIWIGPALSWQQNGTTLSFEWLADASGHSKGTQASLSLERRFTHGRWSLTPRIGATVRSAKTVNYYFGVDASEARAWRPTYKPGSSTGADLGARLTYSLDASSFLLLDAGIGQLGNAVKASPLTENSTQRHLFVGYLHNF